MKQKKERKIIASLFNLILVLGVLLGIFYLIVTQLVGEEFTKTGIIRTIEIGKEIIGWETKKTIDNVNGEIRNINSEETGTTNQEKRAQNFYEQQINEYSRRIYGELEANKEKLKTGTQKIDFGTSFNTLLNMDKGEETLNRAYQIALDAFFLDHPEIFYLDIQKMYMVMAAKTIFGQTTYNVTIEPEENGNYLNDQFASSQKVNQAIAEVEEITKGIIENSPELMYEKIIYIHDWLVDNNNYDTTLQKNNIHNIYGALVSGEAVCEGYAKAFQYVINRIGLNCITVVGEGLKEGNDTEAHAWNYIQLNGSWYGVDVTWDDPIVVGGKQTKAMKRKHFLRGKQNFEERHLATGEASQKGMRFTYPALSDTDF